MEFLRHNVDVFAYAYSEMERIDPSIMSHQFHIHPNRKPIRQKRQVMDVEHYQAWKEKVDKLLS